MKEQVLDLLGWFIHGDLSLSNETVMFLRNWLSGRILCSNKKYGPFLNAKGVK